MTGFAAPETTSNAKSTQRVRAGQADDQQPTAMCQELRDPGEGVVEIEMVQHGRQSDQVSPAIARRRTKVSEVASVDAHLRRPTQTRARRDGHAFITVDSGEVREVRGQLSSERAFAAADVYRSLTARGQVEQNPAVEVLVVAPGVPRIDLGQRLMQRPREASDIHQFGASKVPTLCAAGRVTCSTICRPADPE
ncbi:MAG TPA: hypothetical protein VG253_17615 [Streptosporangiaceae bacterium]|nr:hypothetical protein [Streptosporangiaceae bacterium]